MKQIVKVFLIALANSLPSISILNKNRYWLFKLVGIHFSGKSFIIKPLIIAPLGGCSNISIGKNTFVNMYCRFACPGATITIGDDVAIGPNVSFETVNHGLTHTKTIKRGTINKPINVEDRVWIGAGAIILQGVTVGEGAVICAGAVVNKNVEAYTVYGGVPAKKLKDIII